MANEMRYEDIRGQLRTGDIVLFSSGSPLSLATKIATNSPWSHVGMVLCMEEYEFVTVWESTTGAGVADVRTRSLKKGVQLTPLSDRMRYYMAHGGRISIRQLSLPTPFGPDDTRELMKLRREMRDKPYEKDKLELVGAAFDGIFPPNHEDLSSVFCSELVAEAYQRLKLVDEAKPSNEYTPADFSEKRGLQLLRGALQPEVPISAFGPS